MQIFSIPFMNNSYNTQKKTPSFQKLDKFTAIKQIEGLTCACCGEKVLSANKYAETITSLSKSLHIAMRKGNLNFVKNLFPESWLLLRNFTYKYPNKSLDEIMESSVDYTTLKKSIANKLDNPALKPQTPQRLELDREISRTFFNILSQGRSYMKESAIVMETIKPLKPLLKGKNLEIYEMFEKYSKLYPEKTLSEIVIDVHDDHEIKANKFRDDNLSFIYEKFDAIKNVANNSGAEITKELENAQDEIISIYEKDDDGIQFRNQEIRRIYNRILKKNKCHYLFYDIMKHIKELPPTLQNVDTFIVNAYDYKYTDAKILLSIFRSNFSSEEKIQSLEENGLNKIGNKIVMCNHCVKIRNNNPFHQFVKEYPEMIKNTQKQMNIIANEILAKNLDGNFRFYPLIIAHKFKELSNNMINLDLIAYCQEILKDSKSRILELNGEVERYKNSRNENFNSIKKYPKLELDFLREINRIDMKLDKITKQIATEKSLQKYINDYLASTKISDQ